MVKNPLANAEGLGSIPGSRRSPGEGNGEILFQKHRFTEKSKHTQKNMLCKKRNSVSHSVVSDSFVTHGLQLTRLLCPWDSPGKNTGVACHSLLQGIFPTKESNPGLLHCSQIPHRLNHQGSPMLCMIPFIFCSKRQSQSMVGEVRVAITSSWEGRKYQLERSPRNILGLLEMLSILI